MKTKPVGFSGSLVRACLSTDLASAFGTGQTPVFSAIRSQGDQGGEFFFIPTDVAPLIKKRIALVRLRVGDPNLDASLMAAWDECAKAATDAEAARDSVA